MTSVSNNVEPQYLGSGAADQAQQCRCRNETRGAGGSDVSTRGMVSRAR